jgi:hypothetical protein
MDQIRNAGEMANDEANEISGVDVLGKAKARDLRTLSELELAFAAGGDVIICW